VGIQMKKIQPV